MKPKLIIGFGGLKFSGKTTAATTVQRMFAEQTAILPYAGPLKAMCKEMFGLTHEQMNDPVQKETVDPRWGLTPRQIMQRTGKMFRDFFGEDFWVWKLEVEVHKTDKPVILIDDVRYENEVVPCNYLFMIHRKNQGIKDNHESENPPYHLSYSDIVNDYPTVQDYERAIRGNLVVKLVQEYLSNA